MTRARAWAASVPPGVWTAVAGLVLLASVGVAVVLGAGLSVWSGGVGGAGKPPTVVVAPPRSGLVVVTPPAAPVVSRPPVAPPAATATAPTRGRVTPAPTVTSPRVAVSPPVRVPESTRPFPSGHQRLHGRPGAVPAADVARLVSALSRLLAVDRNEVTQGLPARLSLTSATLEQMTRSLLLGGDVTQPGRAERVTDVQEQVQAVPLEHAAVGRGHDTVPRGLSAARGHAARHAARSHGRHAGHRQHWRWQWHADDDRG